MEPSEDTAKLLHITESTTGQRVLRSRWNQRRTQLVLQGRSSMFVVH